MRNVYCKIIALDYSSSTAWLSLVSTAGKHSHELGRAKCLFNSNPAVTLLEKISIIYCVYNLTRGMNKIMFSRVTFTKPKLEWIRNIV